MDESIRINTEPTHPLHGNVVAWMDSDQKAESIIQALCRLANDPEEKDRLTTYRNARTKQLRGANMPGRTALKEHTKSPEDVTLVEKIVVDIWNIAEFCPRLASRSRRGSSWAGAKFITFCKTASGKADNGSITARRCRTSIRPSPCKSGAQ